MSPASNRPIVTLEEHFISQASVNCASPPNEVPLKDTIEAFDAMTEIYELGPKRLADMDAGQVTMQVISHGPGVYPTAHCRATNDQLADAVRAHPTRFAGFADLPMNEPEEAAAELRRTVKGAGFVGALVDSHTTAGRYYDGPEYDVLWTAAVELDVPIYIHPTWPSEQFFEAYKSPELMDTVNTAIMSFGWGWHSDVAVHILRLYAAGIFEKFPALKVIIGHMGEMLPFMLQRIQRISGRWGEKKRSFMDVWNSNLWITTSGNWSLDPLACILRNTAKDRILYSVDYPFAKNAGGLKWLEELEESQMVSAEELEGIRWKNAANLLRLNVAAT
ncbi:unnamed protein product [Discula destructiva]